MTIHHAIAIQTQRTPAACALEDAGRFLTYAELAARVASCARWLVRQRVRAGDGVAVPCERSPTLIALLLAIARIGAYYLPLDPELPAARRRQMLEDAGIRRVIEHVPTQQELAAVKPAAESDEADAAEPADDDLLCVLFTSGSTGRPKGVELTHRNVANCLTWMQTQYGLGGADAMLHKTPYTFDVSMYELFWPLMVGARVVLLAPEGHKDPACVAHRIREAGVTAAHFVPALLAALLEEPEARQCGSLRAVFAAGEALPYALTQRFYDILPTARLHNLYGPTEAGVVSHWSCPRREARGLVPIGFPVTHTSLHVLDATRQPVSAGEEGELYVGGVQLARGYANRPELTAERFIHQPQLGRLYRTGDRVRQLDDGSLEYLGRRDFQVKIRGLRVELGEIEAHLAQHPDVAGTVAGVWEPAAGDQRLVAWVQPRSEAAAAGVPLNPGALRHHLAARLPQYMIPQHFVTLATLPTLSNGKVDRAALPPPPWAGNAPPEHPPAVSRDQAVAHLWKEVLGVADVDPTQALFDSGGTSLHALRIVAAVRERLGIHVTVTQLFAAPTLAAFTARVRTVSGGSGAEAGSDAQADAARVPESAQAGEPIAIIGMACRVPGAEDVDAFWSLLAEGREGLRDLDDEQLRTAGVSAEERGDRRYVRRAGVLTDADCFDAEFFGYTPAEAALTDPQQRLLLECAWQAMEHAGVAPLSAARVGVYMSLAGNQYGSRRASPTQTHDFQSLIASDKDYAATRIAFKLDLRGPAMTLQTACSSSGAAVHTACQALRSGDCEVALIGGVRVNIPLAAGYLADEGGALSSTGRVRPFAEGADGMVLTPGVACLVLKPQRRALADGDRIYALIRATALNNDGAPKAGYTAPSQAGQTAVIRAALAAAGIPPQSVSYVEAHGTGTAVGDPIEVAALAEGYAGAAGTIALGSVKSNIGHTDAAAAALGLIKTALSLWRAELVPTLHLESVSAACEFERSPFAVNVRHRPWTASPRRAGVSSFGFGGTNFHAVLEQPPEQPVARPARAWQLFKLSARSERALREQAERLAVRLAHEPVAASTETLAADVAWTLDVGRARLPYRAFVTARHAEEAAARLRRSLTVAPPARHSRLVMMFPGQGAQHLGMGRALYECEPAFREAFDQCAGVLAAAGVDLPAVLYPSVPAAASADERLTTTEFAQPAVFVLSYATARLWESWGLSADAVMGHSVGEFVAATLAGVFELEHALHIVVERGRLMQGVQPGRMLAVRQAQALLAGQLPPEIEIGAVNAPGITVLTGPAAAIGELEATLTAAGVGVAPLHTSHAFHSASMEPVLRPFEQLIARYPRHPPRRRALSTLTGRWVRDEWQQPAYWSRQLRRTVQFAAAVATAVETPGCVLLEAGPGQSLTQSARQCLLPQHRATVIASLPRTDDGASADEHVVAAAGRLFLAGIELDPRCFHAAGRVKVGLPGYPFARVRHWIDAEQAPAVLVGTDPAEAASCAPTPAEPTALTEAVESAVRARLIELLRTETGVILEAGDAGRSFLDLGFDSLILTQIATRVRQTFRVELRFRELLSSLGTLDALSAHLESRDVAPPVAARIPAAAPISAAAVALGPSNAAATAAPPPAAPRNAFGAGVRISTGREDGLTPGQQAALRRFIAEYEHRTAGSKASAQRHRRVLADPRTASGFRPLWKELVYPVVSTRSEGAYLWDVDGNRYIDLVNGFGASLFGHKPDFVDAALRATIDRGYEIGPVPDFVGEVAERFTRMTGMERVAFCNTGSEAVLAAVRCARTVTGRELIGFFHGDYHGVNDEALVRAGPNGASLPAVSGVPRSHVANTLLLEYGSPASLEMLRARADELAAVMIEPVQSRHPALQPRQFMHDCRALTRAAGIAFIMDEVITGFRCAPGGAQAYFDVRADLATYGKVFGGGMPVGAVAGSARFMDALDGGWWQFGDDSVPEAGVTYFAGTFVRHPLAMAAALATLRQLEAQPQLQAELNARVAGFVGRLQQVFDTLRAPLRVAHFSSFYGLEFTQEEGFGELLYAYLRGRGLHSYDGRIAVVTTAHTDAVLEAMLQIYRDAVAAMQRDGLLGRVGAPMAPGRERGMPAGWSIPPCDGARLGRDTEGNPAWFVADGTHPGRWVPVSSETEAA
jgi:amino acid adenylation domain-containing protein